MPTRMASAPPHDPTGVSRSVIQATLSISDGILVAMSGAVGIRGALAVPPHVRTGPERSVVGGREATLCQ